MTDYITAEEFDTRRAEGENPADLYAEAQLFEITGTVQIRALDENHAREIMAGALLGDPVVGGALYLGLIAEPEITVTGLEG